MGNTVMKDALEEAMKPIEEALEPVVEKIVKDALESPDIDKALDNALLKLEKSMYGSAYREGFADARKKSGSMDKNWLQSHTRKNIGA